MQIEGAPDLRQIPMQLLAAADEARAADLSRGRGLLSGPSNDEGDAGRAVESLFSTMLVRELRRSLPEGLFTGAGADVFTSWFDEHLGETLAKRDALGLSRLVEGSLERRATPEGEGESSEPVDAPPVLRASDTRERVVSADGEGVQ